MLHWIQLRADAGVCVRGDGRSVSSENMNENSVDAASGAAGWLAHYQNADPLTLSLAAAAGACPVLCHLINSTMHLMT
jgi:hypothetical protein